MSHFQHHREFYDKPVRLSKEEEKEPIKVIKEFFDDYRLSELRQIQDQILKVCLTSDEGAFTLAKSRSNLLSYNDHLIRLLEAAAYLKDSFVPLANELKTEVLPTKVATDNKFDMRVSDIVRGINDVAVDVAHLCVIIVRAWTAKVCAEMKIPAAKNKKVAPPSPLPPVDLDKLHSMALTLQNKLAKLAGIGVNILITELDIHYINPQ